MNFEFVVEQVRKNAFPLEKIKRSALDIKDSDIYVSEKKLDNEYDKQAFSGFQTNVTKHQVADTKMKHDCLKTIWTTSLHGYPVQHSYKFCGSCKDYFNKRTVVFDNENNCCKVIEFDY